MKKCVRCGALVDEASDECDKCGFIFSEYEALQKANTIKVEVDPQMTKQEKLNRVDYPIGSFILGIVGVILSLSIIPTKSILIIIISIVVNMLTMIGSAKASLVKLRAFSNVAKWLSYIGICVSVFSTVYLLMGLII